MTASIPANLTNDQWQQWRDKYADPTPTEWRYIYISGYQDLFDCEKDDFVVDKNWRETEEEFGIPNLRQVIIEFLHQVRESKGYDVTLYIPGSPFYPLPLPMDGDDYYYNDVMEATECAISEINIDMKSTGKRYEVVSLDKVVHARGNRTYLLTLNVMEKEVDENGEATESAAETLKTIRASVFKSFEGAFLLEWKFKP